MTNPRAKAISCSLRKTHPIGPIIFCKDLYCFEDCVKISKVEKAQGLDEVKGPYRAVNREYYGKARCCLLCGKSIAKPETPHWSFKGMFAIHVKSRHGETWQAYKREEVKLEELFFVMQL